MLAAVITRGITEYPFYSNATLSAVFIRNMGGSNRRVLVEVLEVNRIYRFPAHLCGVAGWGGSAQKKRGLSSAILTPH
jgi:hypothetical protein